jgi:SAM-dependent methyltransferase
MEELQQAVDSLFWYHSFDLPGGVVTKGLFDHRKMAGRLPMPAVLHGKRCLDAAASDGFWGFEMARRGAAEVVSVVLSNPEEQQYQNYDQAVTQRTFTVGRADRAFELVRQAYGYENIRRVDLSVYDLDPATLGTFDYVFMGNILLHLRDPAGAVAAVRRVLAPDGELLSFEQISLSLTALFRHKSLAYLWDHDEDRWWTPNMAAHRRLVQAGGFEVLGSGGPMFQPIGTSPARRRRLPRRSSEWFFWTVVVPLGVPSAWVRARPALPRPVDGEQPGR